MSLLIFANVSKTYSEGAPVVSNISLRIQEGEFAALAGPSGSGKTTLLNLAAGLDMPTGGSVTLLGRELKTLCPLDLSCLRREQVGFIFQAYNLFPVLTALENVEYPLALKRCPPRERRRLALTALAEVGLATHAKRFPSELSGGEQQRVAIARATVTKPKIVFADEPTANLDSATAAKLLLLFRELNERKNITFLFSSHDPIVLKIARRVIEISDGKIKENRLNHTDAPSNTLSSPLALSSSELETGLWRRAG